MWQSPPPKPPKEAVEYLLQMTNYYRELVEYHQNAATEAELRLNHLEVLLGDQTFTERIRQNNWSLRESSASKASLIEEHSVSSTDNNSYNELERAAGDSATRTLPEPELSKPDEEKIDTEIILEEGKPLSSKNAPQELEQPSVELPKPPEPSEEPLSMEEEIATLLEANRGKILHLDFIVKEIAAPEPVDLKGVTTAVDKQLQEGAARGRWARITDAPDCWTIDLTLIPDSVAKDESQSKLRSKTQTKQGKSKGGKSARIPSSSRLDQYEQNLPAAIQGCLQERYPSPARTGDIFDWLYPDGLPKKQSNQVKKAIGNALLNHLNRLGWEKVGIGLYVWKGEVTVKS